MQRIHLTLTTLLLAATAGGRHFQDSNDAGDLVPRLAARLERAAEWAVGLEALVAVGGEPLLHAALGKRERGAAVPAASMQRALTALALLRKVGGEVPAVAEGAGGGRFDLDQRLAALLPNAVPEGAACTVRQALAGTSGLAPYGALLTREEERGADAAALTARVREAGLVATPGRCFDPNESEELLLGLLVERLYGATCAEVFTALIGTAELAGTGYVDAAALALAVREDELDLERRERPALAPFGEDRLRTTVPDLARLVEALAGRDLLDEAALRALLTPQPAFTARGVATTTGYGLGVDLVRLGEHSGATVGGAVDGPEVGAAFHVVRYPDVELTIVLAADGRGAPLAELGRDLARLVLGLPPPGVQDLELDAAAAGPLSGTYQFGCDRLKVARGEDGRLTLSWVNRPTRRLLWQGGLEFVAADDGECRYLFRMAPDGTRAEALILMEHGSRSEAVRTD